jgi:hypothetical protein
MEDYLRLINQLQAERFEAVLKGLRSPRVQQAVDAILCDMEEASCQTRVDRAL